MLSVTLLTEELNLRAVGIVTFSGWQLLAIILKCNNVNAICHDWSCRERGENRKRQTGLGGGGTEGEDGEIKACEQERAWLVTLSEGDESVRLSGVTVFCCCHHVSSRVLALHPEGRAAPPSCCSTAPYRPTCIPFPAHTWIREMGRRPSEVCTSYLIDFQTSKEFNLFCPVNMLVYWFMKETSSSSLKFPP